MSAPGATVCPSCEGLKNATDWLCGGCWGLLSALEQREAMQAGVGHSMAIERARRAYQARQKPARRR